MLFRYYGSRVSYYDCTCSGVLCSWSALQVGTLSLRLVVVSICNIWDYLDFSWKPAASSLQDPTGPQFLESGLCPARRSLGAPWLGPLLHAHAYCWRQQSKDFTALAASAETMFFSSTVCFRFFVGDLAKYPYIWTCLWVESNFVTQRILVTSNNLNI